MVPAVLEGPSKAPFTRPCDPARGLQPRADVGPRQRCPPELNRPSGGPAPANAGEGSSVRRPWRLSTDLRRALLSPTAEAQPVADRYGYCALDGFLGAMIEHISYAAWITRRGTAQAGSAPLSNRLCRCVPPLCRW